MAWVISKKVSHIRRPANRPLCVPRHAFKSALYVNSFPPSAAYMRQWTGSALAAILSSGRWVDIYLYIYIYIHKSRSLYGHLHQPYADRMCNWGNVLKSFKSLLWSLHCWAIGRRDILSARRAHFYVYEAKINEFILHVNVESIHTLINAGATVRKCLWRRHQTQHFQIHFKKDITTWLQILSGSNGVQDHWRYIGPPAIGIIHEDVIKWKDFPRYWLFVRGIHRSPVNSPHKASDAELWCFLWPASE